MATSEPHLKSLTPPSIVVLLGPQGCGKDEQMLRLISKGFKGGGTGQLARERCAADQAFNAQHGETVTTGGLLPNNVIADMVQHIMATTPPDCTGVGLNGAFRTGEQAKEIGSALLAAGYSLRLVHIVLSDDICLSRLLDERGEPRRQDRPDDTADRIERRLGLYREHEADVLAECAALGIPIITIDGDGTIEEVAQRIHTALDL